jgi:AmmeMemoRadiSam system protein A
MRREQHMAPPGSALTTIDRRALTALARAAIATRLGCTVAQVARTPAFDLMAGAFVTVFVDNALRGCIGMTDQIHTLEAVVTRCATEAAFEDPRFAPVARADLGGLAVEISVLTPLAPLTDPATIQIGRHGLVVERGWCRGLLLPQVAVERRWSAREFLHHTCLKAGLPPDAWERGASIYCFEADVFGEGAGDGVMKNEE